MEYKCTNISKSYHKFAHKKETVALENINLTFNSGEIIGIVGLASSGKSMLVDILSGGLKANSGELSYNPKNVVRVYKEGYVKLNKNLTVYDNMVLFGKKEHMSELDVENRMVQIRDIFSLNKYINTKVSDLDIENKVKCELAMTLLPTPRMLFIDDAFSFLNHTSKTEILKCLKRLNKEERTVIVIVASNINDVDKIINRIILMDNNEIIYDTNYLEFKEKYCKNKIFEVYLNKNVSIDTLKGIEIIESNDYHYKLLFENKDGIFAKVINLFDVNNIMDLSVGNIALSDIVEKIRKGE